jgi:hypothetical protein
MRISPQQVHELLEIVEAISRTADAGERRGDARVLTQVRIEAVHPPDRPDETFLATLLDVSREGVGIRCGRDLAVGDRFIAHLPFENRTVRLLCTVVNKSAVQDGVRIGARFDELDFPAAEVT